MIPKAAVNIHINISEVSTSWSWWRLRDVGLNTRSMNVSALQPNLKDLQYVVVDTFSFHNFVNGSVAEFKKVTATFNTAPVCHSAKHQIV